MKTYRLILIIGAIEILIGLITLFVNFIAILFSANAKSLNVLVFVIIASGISTLLGIGILKFKKIAYKLLLYFASVVLLSKILLMLGIIQLNGQLETTVPGPIKNTISIVYHGFLIYYLRRQDIKGIFHD